MTVRQTCVKFCVPKKDVNILDKVVFFHFGEEEVGVPKAKMEILDSKDDNLNYNILIWKWVFMKSPVLVKNVEYNDEFIVEHEFSIDELIKNYR